MPAAPDPRRRRLYLVGLLGNLVLLPVMCSAGIGTGAETWILEQADECLGAWKDSNDDDPRGENEVMALQDDDERWLSRTEAEFRLYLPVTDPGGETATVQAFWLRCEAHSGEDDVTIVDSVELRP